MTFFSQLKIGQRLALSFGLLLMLQATLVLVSLVQAHTLFGAFTAAAKAWAGHDEALGNTLALTAAQTYQQVLQTTYGFAAGALLLSMLAWFALSRSLIRPLRTGIAFAQACAQGDLSQRLEARSHEEVGELLVCLNDMTQHLASLVSDVTHSAESVNVATREIAQGNDDLSQRTQAQAASLEETAASMEQITVIGQNNAQAAAHASELARTTHDLAANGGTVVAEAIVAMAAINHSSSRIATIIGVIDGIAFQTNLLALNAAVEAARAGEQGRGFAVVAAEVRELAQRSANAAKEIKTLIDESVAKVRTGSELVDRSGERLARIVDSVRQISVLITQIADASREQAQGVARINDVIVQLDANTQQNAALVEQCSAASHALAQQAEALTRRAGQFRLPGQTAGSAPAAPLAHAPAPAFARRTSAAAGSAMPRRKSA